MIVIRSGFARVSGVALAGGRVAATKGIGTQRMTPEDIAAAFGLGPMTPAIEGLNNSAAWEAKSWSVPPGGDESTSQDGDDYPFGLAIDSRTGHVLHGCRNGIVRSSAGWEVEPGGGPLQTFALSPDGARLVCATEWHGAVVGSLETGYPSQLWSYHRGRTKAAWRPEAAEESDGFVFSHLAFFADGKTFASVEWSKSKRGRQYELGSAATLRVHDLKTLRAVAFAKVRGPVDALAVCGRSVAIRSGNGLKVWESPSLDTKPVSVVVGDAQSIVAADPHGRFLLTASDSAVSVWDAKVWSVSKTYDWQAGSIVCLAVAPDGLTAAAGTATGNVVVWDVE